MQKLSRENKELIKEMITQNDRLQEKAPKEGM